MLSNICTTEVFLFAVLSQSKWGGGGGGGGRLNALASQMAGESM